MEKRFSLRLFLFVIPFLVCSIASFIHAFLIGEASTFSWVLEQQEANEVPLAYQPEWSRSEFLDYKLTAVALRQPELMVIGSSRVTFMRSAFANRHPEAFYNAGIPNMSISEASLFFREVVNSGNVPQVLIIGLDLPDYNAQRGNYRQISRNVSAPNFVDALRWSFDGTQRLAKQWLTNWQGAFSPATENYELLGLQAFAQNEGFLWDGSRFVAGRTEEGYAQNLANDMALFERRESYFRGGNRLDPDSIQALNNLLELAQANNVFVIGYLPPYRPSVWAEMQASGEYSYMALAQNAIAESFAKHQFPFYDFTEPATFGGSESEMTDTWHGVDLLSLRIYRAFLERHPTILQEYSDATVLDEWIRQYANRPLEQFAAYLP